jgi:hypothetical protein
LTIYRYGESPPFIQFGLDYVLETPGKSIPPAVAGLFASAPKRLKIPSYQRGIAWRDSEVSALLDSNSALFGTVILAKFDDPNQFELVDGLQRFATVTSMLYSLYPKVLSPTPSNVAAAQLVEFKSIQAKASWFFPLIEHNHQSLLAHPRQAIRSGYEVLYKDVDEKVVANGLSTNLNVFARKVQTMLLVKQISLDPYTGFRNNLELAHTFINMNTTGVELVEVDLLRAKIVDQAISLHWPPAEIETTENEFTMTFEGRAQAKQQAASSVVAYERQLKVLGTVINDAFDNKFQSNIFPNWNSLTQKDVMEFLQFIDNTSIAAASNKFPYVKEITECGGYPFSTLLLHYYIHSKLTKPDFASGNGVSTTNDCHTLLRAIYRRLIDGSIGRTEYVPAKIIEGTLNSISQIADEINPPAAGKLNASPNRDWLYQKLRQSELSRAPRIFNAMLLPDRAQTGGSFSPLNFGRTGWQVDHLIPKASFKENLPGIDERDNICNLAPLPANANIQMKHQMCSVKLGPGGVYSAVVRNKGGPQYLAWLTRTHYPAYAATGKLDNQAFLERNTNPAIGDERIKYITDVLVDKL